MSPNPLEEMIAVYNRTGVVTGQVPRARVYAEGLWHSSAGVLLRSGDGERIYVHRRTDTKSVFAGMHDCLAGGVVDPGETAEQTARRELAEELGVTGVPLRPRARISSDGTWDGRPMRCHLVAFEARYDGPIRHQASEIADGWWWTDRQLAEHLADPAWAFVPDTRLLIPRLLRP